MILATFTLQHTINDSLSTVLDALKTARRRLVSGKSAVEFNTRFGIVGSIRSLEVTYGNNGWHPHQHVLMFFDREVPIIPFENAIKEQWTQCIRSTGRYASWEHGCDVRFSDKDISEYIAKFGKEPKWTAAHEMTKSVAKLARDGGSTPLQLLSDYIDGDEKAGELWREYAINFKGEKQLYWSKGLREKLGVNAPEKTDEELATEETEVAVILASLSVRQWRVVLGNDARAELLEVAATGDAGRLWVFLQDLGVKSR